MFKVDEDNTIHLTRGDIAAFGVTADSGEGEYTFQPGDLIRMMIYEKKGCDEVCLSKDFPVEEATQKVSIHLDPEETKLGDMISKPKDYWYEVTLNPDTLPQTIIGYDEDGPKLLRLYPEGGGEE